MNAPFATDATRSKGRLIKEADSPTRGPYQRDRDRIIHSSAFRRLRNKTQVFIESEGDYFRTRLTHSLEVAQIARTLARLLKVDEDLTEALALAHDLGHTCYGHAGEKALDEAMQALGSFDHNEQTFRILTLLEKRYAAFDGLNLTWEMLEGVVKHNGPLLPETADEKVPPTIRDFQAVWDLELAGHAGIEAQIAAIADDIAYNTHDFDDGFRAGFFTLDELAALPIFDAIVKKARRTLTTKDESRIIHEIVREAIGVLAQDVLDETRARLAVTKPQNAEEVRAADQQMVAFSAGVEENLNVLREFLMCRMYRHEKVNAMTGRAAVLVKSLFAAYMNEFKNLPPTWQQALAGRAGDKPFAARLIADYVAGMTDRFAETEYKKLFPNASV